MHNRQNTLHQSNILLSIYLFLPRCVPFRIHPPNKTSTLALLELNQSTMTVLGVQEDHRLAVGADLGDRVEGLNTLGHQIIHGLVDIINLDTNMVNAARLVLVEEPLNG